QLIRESDVDGAGSVLGQRGQICRPSICLEELALTEQQVEIASSFASVAVEGADVPVVRTKLDHDATVQNALGAVYEVERLCRIFLESQIRALRQNRFGQKLGCSGR